MTKQEAAAAVKKYGSVAGAARALNVPRSTLKNRLAGMPEGTPRRGAVTVAPSAHGGKSLAEFRAVYDKATIVPAKIRAGLKALAGGWEYEVSFARLAGVSLQDLGNFRDQFAEHVVALRDHRRAWAATPALAGQMREAVA